MQTPSGRSGPFGPRTVLRESGRLEPDDSSIHPLSTTDPSIEPKDFYSKRALERIGRCRRPRSQYAVLGNNPETRCGWPCSLGGGCRSEPRTKTRMRVSIRNEPSPIV